jgi:hypothetical protein
MHPVERLAGLSPAGAGADGAGSRRRSTPCCRVNAAPRLLGGVRRRDVSLPGCRCRDSRSSDRLASGECMRDHRTGWPTPTFAIPLPRIQFSGPPGANDPVRGEPRVPCRAGGRLLSRLHRRGVAAP